MDLMKNPFLNLRFQKVVGLLLKLLGMATILLWDVLWHPGLILPTLRWQKGNPSMRNSLSKLLNDFHCLKFIRKLQASFSSFVVE